MRSEMRHAIFCSLPTMSMLAGLRLFVGPEVVVARGFIDALRSDTLLSAFIAYFTAWGNYILYGIFVFLFLRAKREGNRDLMRFVGVFCLVFAVTLVLVYLLKGTIGRARPYMDAGFTPWMWESDHHSFPSGHTTEAILTIIPVCLLFRSWTLTLVLSLYAAGVAFTRVYLGVHFLTDIFGGVVMGTVGGLSAWLVYRGKTSQTKQP